MNEIKSDILSVKIVEKNNNAIIEPTKSLELSERKRPSELEGKTYKIKPPTSESATYVTICNIEHDGKIVPFEIFINSKDVAHQQWIAAITRTVSAVFRQGMKCDFLLDELEEIVDPDGGGYFKNGRYYGGLVAEIGCVIKKHMAILESNDDAIIVNVDEEEEYDYPEAATLCPKCKYKAVVVEENCAKCLHCRDSKCG